MHKTEDVVKNLKKLMGENPVSKLFIGIDYGEMESKAVAMLMENNGDEICLKELYILFENEEPRTPFEEMIKFCELYGCNVDNVGDLINGDDSFIQKTLKKHYPEMREWYNKHMQKPCGEVPLGEGVKCTVYPELKKLKVNTESIRTGRTSSKKENKSNDSKGI